MPMIPIKLERRDGLVRVVRCKDCKYCSVNRYADGNVYGYVCIEMDYGVNADDFCSRGKRRDEDETHD